jgi:predicted flap endonuclease-1-like 5' DNA nuclease
MGIPCILIPAVVGLISGILGYLLGSAFSKKGGDNSASLSLQSDLDACRANSKSLSARISGLEADLASAKAGASANMQSFASSVATNTAGLASIPYDSGLAFSVLGKKFKQDDLKVVEGIGPKIEQLYHNAGIKTWLALSQTPVEKSQSILDAAGERYKIHNPSTWAKQAGFAHQGKWKELKDWQENLKGGKE